MVACRSSHLLQLPPRGGKPTIESDASKNAIIVIGIILLVILAFAILIFGPEPEYKTENTAEAVVYNYLLALQQEDYAFALEQIAGHIPNRPADAAEMEWDISQDRWRFENRSNSELTIAGSRIVGDSASVTVSNTWSTSPLEGGVDSTEFTMRLQRQDGIWKLIDGQISWAREWGAEND